ncbi:MAG: M1 family metallopeptidase, partial [Cyanobacteria bacterium]|nr:M1 family metallopeptidase [Cyanobacteriota bacterium]
MMLTRHVMFDKSNQESGNRLSPGEIPSQTTMNFAFRQRSSARKKRLVSNGREPYAVSLPIIQLSNRISATQVQSILLILLFLTSSIFTPLAATASESVSTKSENESASKEFQLPRSAVPELYDLTFSPNLKTFTFTGAGDITLSITKPTDSIVLNSLDLEISPASIAAMPGGEPQNAEIKLDPAQERATLKFPTELQPGKYRLRLVFKGQLNDKLRGFYRSYYTDSQGNKQWIATTQMEPTDARRMFPCFDEPDMKARFKFTAVIDKDLTAISNGGIESEELDERSGQKVVTFKESPKMSSYLVALIVGKFKSTETRTACGVPVRVWALDGKDSLGMFALDAACKILEFQSKYFDIPYPTDKLDLIAIPDFRSGAMENLGAVTFRENNLLVDEKTGSNFLKRRVFAIIAHELAHQWFGDLVTMQWWDDIWLNEAFASWMGTKTVDALRPEWQELTRAILTRNSSMAIDELKATRAIHAEVRDPKQAAEMFDSITYDKGESILWMLEGFVGVQKVQTGIHDYLTAHKFGNAKSDDLWQAIGKASNLPVPELMKTWISQPGFPLLTVTSMKSTGSTTVEQSRFFGTPGMEPDGQLWNIPAVLRE